MLKRNKELIYMLSEKIVNFY